MTFSMSAPTTPINQMNLKRTWVRNKHTDNPPLASWISWISWISWNSWTWECVESKNPPTFPWLSSCLPPTINSCTLLEYHITHTTHSTIHNTPCTLHTACRTLHITHDTLHTSQCKIYTAHCRLQIAHSIQSEYCILHTAIEVENKAVMALDTNY